MFFLENGADSKLKPFLDNKLKKVVTEYPEIYGEPPLVTTTSYCGGFTYLNSELTQSAYEEGWIRWAMQPGGNREYKFEWMIKDHLGNIRMVLTEESNSSTQKQYLATFESQPAQDLKAGNVYFDNLRLVTNEGPVMEENHYYPFGLLMDAISSTGTGKLENKL